MNNNRYRINLGDTLIIAGLTGTVVQTTHTRVWVDFGRSIQAFYRTDLAS